VKINGKEAAVIGSTVTTCNDVGARENSTIMAVGAHIPMPVIIHPKNTAAWKEERREKNPRNPECISVQPSLTNGKEGQTLELVAQFKDIADGNPVTFRVFRRGQDPNTHVPLWQRSVGIENGAAKAPWQYSHPAGVDFPVEDPGFIVVAYSAWCPPKQSDVFTVELRRPEATAIKVLGKEEQQTDTLLAGETAVIEVNLNEDTEKGAPVTVGVYREGSDIKRDKPVEELHGTNEEGTVKLDWKVVDVREPDDKTELKYVFVAKTPRAAVKQSELVSVKNPQVVGIKWEPDVISHGEEAEFTLSTFEIAYSNPTVKIQFWHRGKKLSDTPEQEQPESYHLIYEQEAVIDNDEIDITFDSAYSSDDREIHMWKGDYKVEVKVFHGSVELNSKEYLIVEASTPKE